MTTPAARPVTTSNRDERVRVQIFQYNGVMKICCTCKQQKPLSEFGTYSLHEDGKQSDCKECHTAYRREFRRLRKDPAYVGPGGGSWGSRPAEGMPTALTERERQLIIGGMLGDGSLRINGGSINPYYDEKHSTPQVLYLEWKAGELSRLRPRIYENNGKRLNTVTTGRAFRTLSSPVLMEFYEAFYGNVSQKHIVSRQYMEELGLLGLTVWLQDDGCLINRLPNPRNRRPSFNIATRCFDNPSMGIIVDYLTSLLGARIAVTTQGAIVLTADATRAMAELCAPYWHPCMAYKFPYPELLKAA